MIIVHQDVQVWEGTDAEFAADTRIWRTGDILIVKGTHNCKIGNGTSTYAQLTAVAISTVNA